MLREQGTPPMKCQHGCSGLAQAEVQAALERSLLHPKESPHAQGVVTPA